jgi:hypothetical protein
MRATATSTREKGMAETPSGAPPCGWATLGKVLPPQIVPAAPGGHIEHNGQLSPVSQMTVNRLLGKS